MKSVQELEAELLTKELRVDYWDTYRQVPVVERIILSTVPDEEVM